MYPNAVWGSLCPLESREDWLELKVHSLWILRAQLGVVKPEDNQVQDLCCLSLLSQKAETGIGL